MDRTRFPLKAAWRFFVLLALGLAIHTARSGAGAPEPSEKPPPKKDPVSGAVEIRFSDDSTVKVVLCDERIELETRYGRLQIPVAEIRRIDFSLRMPEEVRKRVEAAVSDLGHKEFRRREEASAELLRLGERAYPALLRASKSGNLELVRRAEKLLEKFQDEIHADHLDLPALDLVYTEDSKIAGHITKPTLRVRTLAFGEQIVKLEDVRGLRSPHEEEGERGGADRGILPDPGSLGGFMEQVGKTLSFRVMAPAGALAAGLGAAYGTDIYTSDSTLAVAAVHAGVLRPGETGVVRVTILGPQAGFNGTMRNGIMSHNYGPWPGFRIERARKGAARKE